MLGFAEHPWCHPAALQAAGMTALREPCRADFQSASCPARPSRSLIARARAPAFARLRLAARRPTFSRPPDAAVEDGVPIVYGTVVLFDFDPRLLAIREGHSCVTRLLGRGLARPVVRRPTIRG